jgi:hypothetical protein
MTKQIEAQFQKYVGTPISGITKTTRDFNGKSYPAYQYDGSDESVKEIVRIANDQELNVRTWIPGATGTLEYRTDRLNVHIEEQDDGSYQIASIGIG